MPQYRYAYGEDGCIVDVLQLSTLDAEHTKDFACIGCGAPLVAKVKGEKRVKHFAHKTASSSCTEETYLHRLAKQVFLDEYQRCLANNESFEIELTYPRACHKYKETLGQSCYIDSFKKSHDLTQRYDTIMLEQRDGQFVPDLLLGSSQTPSRKLYVEIAVTHYLAEPKAASDQIIIEIPIECEEDIDKIRRRRLTEVDASFVNFPIRAAQVVDAACRCATEPYYCLLIYDSGRSVLLHNTLAEIAAERQKYGKQVRYAKLETAPDISMIFDRGSAYAEMLNEAAENGFPVRNCFRCRYAGYNWSWHTNSPVFCKYLKKECGTNEAVSCTFFRTKTDEGHPRQASKKSTEHTP